MRHIVRQVPLEPESYRESLSGPIALENSIGFVFSKQGTQDATLPVPNFELRALKSMADVDAALPRLLTQGRRCHSWARFLKDAWNAIESAAEAAWREARKIAIYIADQVGVSIAGCVLLGPRMDAWVNNKSPLSATFQARDVLNAIGMMFTFADTSVFVNAVGPENAAFVVAGETYVKIAAGCVHIAAIATAE